MSSGDGGVEGTNDEATECKIWAAHKGYLHDPYIQAFSQDRAPTAHLPEISRGYTARVMSVERIIVDFVMNTGPECNVINLGAGFDTLYWRLKEKGLQFSKFVEMDHENVVKRKVKVIRQSSNLLPLDEDSTTTPDSNEINSMTLISSSVYTLLTGDLKKPLTIKKKLLDDVGVNQEAPTIILLECVLPYLTPEQTTSLLTALNSTFRQLAILTYDFVNMDSSEIFCRKLMDNFRLKGVPLVGIEPCRSIDSQNQRFAECGYKVRDVITMKEAQTRFVSKEKMREMDKIEMFDEHILLDQMQKHYCLVLATTSSVEIDESANPNGILNSHRIFSSAIG